MVYDPKAPGWNEGEAWSETDLMDLAESFARGDTIGEIAVFLQRSEDEIHAKIAELGLDAAVE
jgi:hypothetical protein